jgi:D-arabinose 1-dehydrogenase-like Zn-dependent alcohol dehydrogenase
MRRAGGELSLEDVPIPQIGPGEVLVESHTSGICGTELHILAMATFRRCRIFWATNLRAW